MEKFAAGELRYYSGSADDKHEKAAAGSQHDYALWRIKESAASWLNRRKDNNIWHGLTICDKQDTPIGHIILGGGELAYFLIPQCSGQAITSEASCALTKIVLPYIAMNHTDIEVPEQINATVRTDHLASQSVLKYAGFIIDETTETSEKFGNARYEVSRNIVDFIAACEAALPAKTESIYDSAHTIFRSNAGNAASVERTSVSNTM